MHRDARAAVDRHELLELDIEAVGDRKGARRDERVAAVQVAPVDAGQPERDPLAGGRPLDGSVVHLHRANPHLAAARRDLEHVALGDRPRPERAGDDGADAPQREDPVDVEARRARPRRAPSTRSATRASAARSSSRPVPVLALTATTSASGTSSRASSIAISSVSSSTRSAFVIATTPALDAEQPQDREVLERLRSRALGRVDHEQEEVDPGRAGDHRAHEPLVAGHVDQREPASVRQLERRVAEVDRDPAPLLLRQPVGVLARQRPHEPRLAVVDVPGSADRQRHVRAATSCHVLRRARRRRRRDLVDLAVGERAHVEQQAAVAHDPDDGRLAERGAGRTATPRPRRQSSAAPRAAARRRRPGRPSPRPRRRRGRRGARPAARTAATGSASIRSTGISRARPLGVEGESEGSLERRQRELVRPERALERVPAEPLDQLGAAREDPRLRAAEQLVAREAHDVGAGGEARRGRRLVADRRERARAEIVDERQPGPCRNRGELGESGLLGEPDDPEVGLVHAQDHGRLGAERALVVGDPRAVRRPDLDEPRSRAGEHVGDPEAVADLDQLAARDEHLAALGERGQGEHHGGGVVVDDERSLGAGDPAAAAPVRWSWRDPRAPASRSYSRFE